MIVLGKRLGSFWNINEYKLFIHMKIIRGIKWLKIQKIIYIYF